MALLSRHKDSIQLIEDGDQGQALQADVSDRLSLLAHAVAGRRLVVAEVHEERPWSDGERVFVSDSSDGSPASDSVVVQAALIACGSLDPRVVARLTGQRQLRLRYLTLESMRSVELLRAVVPRRVSERVGRLYDGAIPQTREESLSRACDSREQVPEAPAWVGTIKPGRVIVCSAVGRSEPTEADTRFDGNDSSLREIDDEEDSEASRLGKLLDSPVAPGPIARYLQKLLGMGRSPSSEGGAGQDVPTSSRPAGRVGKRARVVDHTAALSMDLGNPPSGRLYPEWDAAKHLYRRDWCAVAEFDPMIVDHPAIHAFASSRLARELARLSSAHERHRRQADGDNLDITALVDDVVARRAGSAADNRVYELKRKTARDLGVLILLDATGSTGDLDEEGRVFDDQRQVAASLTDAFEGLGDRVATYAFQTWGRKSVNFLRVKGFDDRYDEAAQRRLASLEPAGFTRLGAAIRHASHLLRSQAGTPSNLLIVVGDGFPYDDGYEHAYAEADSRRALREVVGDGVGCVHLDIRSGNDEAIRRVWASYPHARLDEPEDLAAAVTPLLRSALKTAGASKRRISPNM
jgi:nitric oxide reductase NorD protein